MSHQHSTIGMMRSTRNTFKIVTHWLLHLQDQNQWAWSQSMHGMELPGHLPKLGGIAEEKKRYTHEVRLHCLPAQQAINSLP